MLNWDFADKSRSMVIVGLSNDYIVSSDEVNAVYRWTVFIGRQAE